MSMHIIKYEKMLICSLFLNWQLKKEYPCITCALHFGILLGTFLIPVIFYTYSGILGTNLTVLDISTFIISVILVTHYLNKTCNRHSNDNCTKHNPVPSEYCKIVFFDEAHQLCCICLHPFVQALFRPLQHPLSSSSFH